MKNQSEKRAPNYDRVENPSISTLVTMYEFALREKDNDRAAEFKQAMIKAAREMIADEFDGNLEPGEHSALAGIREELKYSKEYTGQASFPLLEEVMQEVAYGMVNRLNLYADVDTKKRVAAVLRGK